MIRNSICFVGVEGLDDQKAQTQKPCGCGILLSCCLPHRNYRETKEIRAGQESLFFAEGCEIIHNKNIASHQAS